MKDFLASLVATLTAWGPLGLFLFCIIDGAGLPTPGGLDAFFLLITANRPDDAYWLAGLTIVGSSIGNMILFFIGRKGGEATLAKYRSRPRFQKFEEWFQHYGLVTVFIPAFVPIIPLPLKFFLLCAAVFEVKPLTFLAVFLAARIPRYLGLAYLGQHLGRESYPWLKAHLWHLMGFALALFVILYLVVVVIDRRKRSTTGTK